ncbi:hypothetical protein JANAI62_03370 [Jannaschia pagri]|uniref:Uncharacterized protein n=1 Tax=Jannaschia pagri TaxID=2829797 RepID=A0ABQ4NH23_9RHOB|nr:hypothetical protein JANAI61_06380 [Jannaschia sp. AI_61]GIT93714.1 hypothetical protein JANAI62_03370 [Jannaschia sp. AI_62]
MQRAALQPSQSKGKTVPKRHAKRGQRQLKADCKDVLTGVGKELLLVGLYGVKDLTGVDLHASPKKSPPPWKKGWGAR